MTLSFRKTILLVVAVAGVAAIYPVAVMYQKAVPLVKVGVAVSRVEDATLLLIPSDVDAVIIFRLDSHSEDEREIGSFPVPIMPYRSTPFYEAVTLIDVEKEEFLEIWRKLYFSPTHYNFCHEPVYGIRITLTEGDTFETSLCWKCSSFWVDCGVLGTTYYGFDARRTEGIQLREWIDNRF